MGIRFNCPNGHKLNVKEFLAGKRGVCPQCGAKFIIPTPTDVPLSQVPQPIGVGQSQSVEISISPGQSHQMASAVDSPSVIIPVTEMEVGTSQLELPPVIPASAIPTGDMLPASIVAVQPPLASAATVTSPEAAIVSQRGKSRRNQIVISLLLLALVIFLAGVLIWVLRREHKQAPAEKTAAISNGAFNQAFATASGGLHTSAYARVGASKQWT